MLQFLREIEEEEEVLRWMEELYLAVVTETCKLDPELSAERLAEAFWSRLYEALSKEKSFPLLAQLCDRWAYRGLESPPAAIKTVLSTGVEDGDVESEVGSPTLEKTNSIVATPEEAVATATFSTDNVEPVDLGFIGPPVESRTKKRSMPIPEIATDEGPSKRPKISPIEDLFELCPSPESDDFLPYLQKVLSYYSPRDRRGRNAFWKGVGKLYPLLDLKKLK